MIGTGTSEAIAFINSVDSFYRTARDNLIITISIAGAIIGVVIPLVLQWNQRHNSKKTEQLLKGEIKTETDKLKESLHQLEKSLIDRFENQNIELKEELSKGIETKLRASIKSATFHLQGNTQEGEGRKKEALSDYIIAASASIDCEDNVNLQTELGLIKKLLNGLYYEDLEDLKIQGRDIEKLLGKLEESDQKGFYTQHIRDIKSIMSKLPKKLSEKK